MADIATESPGLVDPRPTDSLARAGLVAGLGLLGMAALSGFGVFYAGGGLTTSGGATATVAGIAESDALFRWGVLSLYGVVVLDVVVAWALLRFFAPVGLELSRLAAWFRLAYASVFLVAIGQLAGLADLATGQGAAADLDAAQVEIQVVAGIEAYNDLWMAGLVLFGVHLVLLGHLAYVSGYVPRVLGALLVIAGAGYLVDSVVHVVLASPSVSVGAVTFVGELLLALWLLARSRHLSPEADRHDH